MMALSARFFAYSPAALTLPPPPPQQLQLPRVDSAILELINQGAPANTLVDCILSTHPPDPNPLNDLIAARLAHAPDSVIAVVCANLQNVQAQHLAWLTPVLLAGGGTVLGDLWIVSGVAARIPLSTVAMLSQTPALASISLDRYRSPSFPIASDEATVLAGARGANRLRTSTGTFIRGAGIRIAIADTGIDLRTDQVWPPNGPVGNCPPQPDPLPAGNCNQVPASCLDCCWIDPNAGGVAFPHGAFTNDTFSPAPPFPPPPTAHRIVLMDDLLDERQNNCSTTPPSILACGNLNSLAFADTPEDINFRCNTNAGFGHGTAMAAIAAGRRYLRCNPTDPTCTLQVVEGWDGVAPEGLLYIFKICDDMTTDSSARDSTIIQAVQAALQNNCHVFNLSFEGDWDPLGPTTQAFDNAGLADLVISVPAGNCGGPVAACGDDYDPLTQPAIRHSLFNGLIVGATAKWTPPPPPPAFSTCYGPEFADTVAEYSSTGPLTDFINVPPLPWVRTGPNITGPSGQIAAGEEDSLCPAAQPPTCTLPNWPQVCTVTEVETAMIDASYTYAASGGVPQSSTPPFQQWPPKLDVGTSGATAFVTGAAALVRQANPLLSALEVRAILLNEADDRRVRLVNLALSPSDYGLGRVDVEAAVVAALEGRVQAGVLDPTTPAVPALIPVEFPADHDVEVTLVWDRVDVFQPQASDLRLNVLDPAGAPVANASALSNLSPDGIVQPDDNFRHFVFRTAAAGVYTLRVAGATFRLSDDTNMFRFAVSWRSLLAPIDSTATMLPSSTILASSVGGVTYPAVGDFNGDGSLDVAANVAGGNAIWWRGPGFTAQPVTGFSGGTRLYTSSVDSDSLDDIVSGISSTAFVGRGGAPRPFPTTIQSTLAFGASFDPFRHAVDDLDCTPVSPSIADLAMVVAQAGTPPSTDLVVHSGDGTGLFVSPATQVTLANHELRGVAGGDFDDDGCPDLVAVGVRGASLGSPRGAGTLACFRGTGSLFFEDPSLSGMISYFPEFAYPMDSALSLVVADFNADSRLDVAVTSGMGLLPSGVTPPTRVIVFAGDGAGHFTRLAEAPAWLDLTGAPGTATANPFTTRHAIGVHVDLEALTPQDIALLGDDASGAPILRVFSIDDLGRLKRREGYPIDPGLSIPTSLAAGGNLLGGEREEVVIGGGPNAGGNAVVEVRRD